MARRSQPKGGQPRGNATARGSARESGRSQFVKNPVMPSAKLQEDQMRRNAIINAEQEYLGQPAQNEQLFATTFIVPGKHMFLPELFEPCFFDDIRKALKVWVVTQEPNVLCIYSRTIRSLKEGLEEIHWAIHDLREAQHNVTSSFMVQLPVSGGRDRLITVGLDSRPTALQQPPLVSVPQTSHIAKDIMRQVAPIFESSLGTLQSLKQTLQMRVDVGHIKIRRRKKIHGNEMTYSDFADMALHYGKRGGADFESMLEGSDLASNTIKHLLKPTTEFFDNHQDVSFGDTISIKMQKNVLEADIKRMDDGPARLTNARLMAPDQHPQLRWIVIAPDREFDWCFRVDSAHPIQPIPLEMSNLINSIDLHCGTRKTSEEEFLKELIDIRINNPKLWAEKIDEIHLRSTVAIPYRDTPFVIEVAKTRVWKGINTQIPPQSWQSIGFYGVHWATELNSANTAGTRKEWGINQCDVWRGSANTTAMGQFEEFVRHVLVGLYALEGVRSRA